MSGGVSEARHMRESDCQTELQCQTDRKILYFGLRLLQNFYAVFHTLCELANATVGQFFVSEEQ
jgi:hypothetical protein